MRMIVFTTEDFRIYYKNVHAACCMISTSLLDHFFLHAQKIKQTLYNVFSCQTKFVIDCCCLLISCVFRYLTLNFSLHFRKGKLISVYLWNLSTYYGMKNKQITVYSTLSLKKYIHEKIYSLLIRNILLIYLNDTQ